MVKHREKKCMQIKEYFSKQRLMIKTTVKEEPIEKTLSLG